MPKYLCEPQNFEGTGYKKGVKQCSYMCYPIIAGQVMRNAGKRVIGPGEDMARGDVCFGVDYHEQWTNALGGTWVNMPDSLEHFVVETGSLGAWWKYPSELLSAIEREFGE